MKKTTAQNSDSQIVGNRKHGHLRLIYSSKETVKKDSSTELVTQKTVICRPLIANLSNLADLLERDVKTWQDL